MVDYPKRISNEAVADFMEEGFFTKAFPYLFPFENSIKILYYCAKF
jgi:hypothetical protein